MSIETLYSETYGDQWIARVRVDYGPPQGSHTAWEHSCDACKAFCTNLTELEARTELAEHHCAEGGPALDPADHDAAAALLREWLDR
jgi:hypothetical protein